MNETLKSLAQAKAYFEDCFGAEREAAKAEAQARENTKRGAERYNDLYQASLDLLTARENTKRAMDRYCGLYDASLDLLTARGTPR